MKFDYCFPLHYIIFPIRFITISIHSCKHSETITFIILKLSLINIAICICLLTFSTNLIIRPFSFILTSVLPFLDTMTISFIQSPLAFIGRAIFVLIRGFLYFASSFFSTLKHHVHPILDCIIFLNFLIYKVSSLLCLIIFRFCLFFL